MIKIPDYINCQNKEILVCDWYMSDLCLETCAYARDIRGIGVGAVCDGGLIERLKENEMDK